MPVAQARLIGEKASERCAEEFSKTVKNWLIHSVEEHFCSLRYQRVEIALSLFFSASITDHHHVEAPVPCGQIEANYGTRPLDPRLFVSCPVVFRTACEIILHIVKRIRYIQSLTRIHLFKAQSTLQKRPKQYIAIVTQNVIQENTGVLDRPYKIESFEAEELLAKFRMIALGLSVGKPGGEVAIIEQPHPHSQLFAFIEYGGEVGEPPLSVEIMMRTCLHAECANAIFMDATNFAAQHPFVFSMDPQEGEDIVIVSSFKIFDQPPHRAPPSPYNLSPCRKIACSSQRRGDARFVLTVSSHHGSAATTS